MMIMMIMMIDPLGRTTILPVSLNQQQHQKLPTQLLSLLQRQNLLIKQSLPIILKQKMMIF